MTVEGRQVTETELTDEAGAACTEIAAFPDTAGFCMLVAVTVAVAAEAGAVKSPVELIAPTLADHVTDELKLPVPCTFAPHCDVPPPATVTGLQVTVTEETDGDGVGCGCVATIP